MQRSHKFDAMPPNEERFRRNRKKILTKSILFLVDILMIFFSKWLACERDLSNNFHNDLMTLNEIDRELNQEQKKKTLWPGNA